MTTREAAFFEESSLPSISITATEEQIITGWNQAAFIEFGYSSKEALGKCLWELIFPSSGMSKKAHAKYVLGFEKGRTARTFGEDSTVFARSKNGDTFPVEIRVFRYKLDGGTVEIGAQLKNISARTEEKKQLEKSNQQLEDTKQELEKAIKRINNRRVQVEFLLRNTQSKTTLTRWLMVSITFLVGIVLVAGISGRVQLEVLAFAEKLMLLMIGVLSTAFGGIFERERGRDEGYEVASPAVRKTDLDEHTEPA